MDSKVLCLFMTGSLMNQVSGFFINTPYLLTPPLELTTLLSLQPTICLLIRKGGEGAIYRLLLSPKGLLLNPPCEASTSQLR